MRQGTKGRVQLYVTRWVLARGILRMDAVLARRMGRDRAQKDWYHLEASTWDRYRRHQVCIGVDAFLTLEEAQAAARVAFGGALNEAQERARRLAGEVERVWRGVLAVHDLTGNRAGRRINALEAFGGDGEPETKKPRGHTIPAGLDDRAVDQRLRISRGR